MLLVIAAHLHAPGFTHGGGSGVTLFFALSGFLITSLVVEEWQSTGTIRLRSFRPPPLTRPRRYGCKSFRPA